MKVSALCRAALFIAMCYWPVSVFSQITYLDNFNTAAYSNNNGTMNFSANWAESGDDASPTAVVPAESTAGSQPR